jgi:primosomal protein N' (replication factor Y)
MSGAQHKLFETEPAQWELDDAGQRRVATVVLSQGPELELYYAVPDRLCETVEVGRRVRVPLGRGNRIATGYCVSLETRGVAGRPLKEITGVVDDQSLLTPAMVKMTRWIANRYLCGWGTVLEAVLPAGVRGAAGTRATTFLTVAADAEKRAAEMKLTEKQTQVLRYLAASSEPMEPKKLALACKCTLAPITALRQKDLIQARRRRVRHHDHVAPVAAREASLQLNPDQQIALDAILAAMEGRRHETILVHGVTGSGKTEIYIQAIEQVIRFGRQAIVLVPEISLTPQTRARFSSRFDRIAVLHSHLSDSERHWHWQRIASGEVQVVVGARSAVFAPTPHLGLIVLDEEHEGSFKQDSAPRYHARDVALFRAAEEKVPLVLGSATPSLESWSRAHRGEYKLVELPRRVFNRPLPDVVTVDLRDETRGGFRRGAISRPLARAMEDALRGGGQVILLLNRRGYATHIQCPACGHVAKCPDCDLALTHHRDEEKAVCHYCDYRTDAPQACPQCQFTGIRYSGLGTQRLEAEVRTRFADYSCLRMDTDTMQGPGSHDRALARFRSGEVRILLGTQMIAKGLDFPNVTLVGVVNADVGLHLPDFRAAERTFQLVTQVAGRTGRSDRGGRVLVQTFTPDHPAIQAAVRHDYARFAAWELPVRQTLSYPPFSAMVRVVVRGPVEQFAEEFVRQVASQLKQSIDQRGLTARVLGPAPAPFAKLRRLFRFHLVALAENDEELRQVVQEATGALKTPDEVQWIVDVDPLDML